MTKYDFLCVKFFLGPALLVVALFILRYTCQPQNVNVFSSFMPAISSISPSPSPSPTQPPSLEPSVDPKSQPEPTGMTSMNATTITSCQKRREGELGKARAMILEAVKTKNYTSDKDEGFVPRGAVYRNS
ncbi:PREDICTED: probable glycosyltransferase At5g20260 [Tarenaya hassleriana]|uniref:probable glycosyltransferase At5g20260 n=1 Tax=Tarenaya hassleriana TaxID=28532 RepID=UPI0008FCF589|nr:PREDICTED: probable glycosyltransferase At5g20260 [Tarenaya hassleriana]